MTFFDREYHCLFLILSFKILLIHIFNSQTQITQKTKRNSDAFLAFYFQIILKEFIPIEEIVKPKALLNTVNRECHGVWFIR
jgi:hypothetical protein